MALNDFAEVTSNTINITAQSSTTFTSANEVNVDLKVSTEPIILTGDQAQISSGITYRNSRGTIYSENECLYIAKVQIFPFAIDRSAALQSYYIQIPEYKAANWCTQSNNTIIAARDLPVLSSNQINQPTTAELNPDSVSFTNGFFKMSDITKNKFLWGINPGTFKPSERTIYQAGFDSSRLSSATTEVNPGILFQKIMISNNGNVGSNSYIQITREDVSTPTKQAFIIIGVERRNA